MSTAAVAAGFVQVAGGVVLSPLIPGAVQKLKARLQGRPGPPVLQPYRDLRRLWSKSGVNPDPHTLVYELVPAVVAAVLFMALLVVPVAGESPGWPTGNDALVLVGLLALARFALALSAWDTGSGFGLMGTSRDLTIAVATEPVLLLILLLVALPAGTTDLAALGNAAAPAFQEPAHWAAAGAFGLVLLAETGRLPIDNPDTHLELTMIHEGPLLEYAGRDLAYLVWAEAARHWVLLVLATGLFVPQPDGFALRLAVLAGALAAGCVLLALIETTQVKLRILRAPLLVATGGGLCLLGLATWFAGGAA